AIPTGERPLQQAATDRSACAGRTPGREMEQQSVPPRRRRWRLRRRRWGLFSSALLDWALSRVGEIARSGDTRLADVGRWMADQNEVKPPPILDKPGPSLSAVL